MTADDDAANAGAPRLSDYDYVRHLTRSRVAWEYLRRNPAYVAAWQSAAGELPRHRRLADGTRVLDLQRRQPDAEAWGLLIFRQSP